MVSASRKTPLERTPCRKYRNKTARLHQLDRRLVGGIPTLNFSCWNNLNSRVYRETFLFKTYAQGVNFLKNYIEKRVDFLTESFDMPAPEAPTEAFVADPFWYRILNQRTNNAIAVSGESVLENAPLVMWEPLDENDGQLWQIASLGNNLFRFVNKHSGLAMASNGRNTNMVQKAIDNNDSSQEWEIVPLFTGGLYGILNPATGYSVNNSGGSFDNGAPAIVYNNNMMQEEKTNQHWYLKKEKEIITSEDRRIENRTFACYFYDNSLLYSNLPENTNLKIYNLQGLLISEKSDISGSGRLEIKLSKGIYIVSVTTKNELYNYKIFNY
ncbi:MAG: RICIN domain-containing protein [Prevotellaceae bacterium]|jgi:hypothetical protein|nr:RICIN domain-containing protein [Prevotellaceae bacterium]